MVSLHLLSPGHSIVFVYSVLLFSSDLLGTVKRVLFVPHSHGLKISLLLLSECCSLPKAAGGEVGRCSAVPEGDHCCSREEHRKNQRTWISSHVLRLHTALPRHGHTLPPLQLSAKPSVLGTPVCIHPPPSTSDWELHFQELCSPAATHRLQNNLISALPINKAIKALFSRVWLACLGCPCPGMPVQRRGEASGGKPHLELGGEHRAYGNPTARRCWASSPACTRSVCGNKRVKIKGAEPGGRFLSAIYIEQISYLCKYYFKANNFLSWQRHRSGL